VKYIAALALGVLIAGSCQAHEGMVDRDESVDTMPPSATALADRPRRLASGELNLPKAAQRLLGIRTEIWSATTAPAPISLLAEVQAQPAAAVTIAAPEPGQLENANEHIGGAWPLPGQTVRAGDVLAWLRPLIPQRDAARRHAQVADLDQKLVIANLNVGRLGMQGAVNADSKEATGNIYLSEAIATRDALVHQRELMAQSLQDRVPLRALVSGTVLAVPARSGDVVASGQTLFQLVDPSRLRLAAISFSPGFGNGVRSARVRFDSAAGAELRYRGEEPLADAVGWRLWFDLPVTSAPLSPGQLVEVQIQAAADGAVSLPADACAVDADGGTVVWIHRAPERFVPLRLKSCTSGMIAEQGGVQLAQGDRLVTHGAGLLSQYR